MNTVGLTENQEAEYSVNLLNTAIKEFNLLVIKEKQLLYKALNILFSLKKKLYCNKTVYNTKIWFIENL